MHEAFDDRMAPLDQMMLSFWDQMMLSSWDQMMLSSWDHRMLSSCAQSAVSSDPKIMLSPVSQDNPSTPHAWPSAAKTLLALNQYPQPTCASPAMVTATLDGNCRAATTFRLPAPV